MCGRVRLLAAACWFAGQKGSPAFALAPAAEDRGRQSPPLVLLQAVTGALRRQFPACRRQ
eukprot:scaffold2798_cov70-Phaeocystis_antarctica.AAC.3